MSNRYQVEPNPCGYWVIDTTIDDGETPSNVFGSKSHAEAAAHADKLNNDLDRLNSAAPELLIKTKQFANVLKLVREQGGIHGLDLTSLEADTLETIAKAEC